MILAPNHPQLLNGNKLKTEGKKGLRSEGNSTPHPIASSSTLQTILNIEQGTRNKEFRSLSNNYDYTTNSKNFDKLRNSLFLVRYSIFKKSSRVCSSILFFFVIVLLSSCGAGKTKTPSSEIITAEGRKVYNPATGRYEFPTEVTGQVDTVKWTDASPSVSDPIDSDPSQYLEEEPTEPQEENPNETGVFTTYNVAIMIPFNSHKVNALEGGIHSSSFSALHYYEGAKMALDELNADGVNLNVSVMDTKRSESEVENLLNRSTLLNAHMIIGPYSSKPLVKVAEFSKKNKKPLLSPVNTSGTITSQNPYYVQINPSLESHCRAITAHAVERYEDDQIVLVCRNKEAEVKRLKYFQDANKEIKGSMATPKFKEFIIDATVAEEYGELDLLPLIKTDKTTVFILPSYSNETFISNFMRQLAISKGPNKVVVYGMPKWMKFNRISYDYYERLNVHVSSANYVNKDDFKIKEFYRKFYERYGTLPRENAFQGYDAVMYFGKQLNKHGMNFVTEIDSEFEEHLSTKFEFERNVNAADAANENFDKINFVENKFVNILRFKDFQFQKDN